MKADFQLLRPLPNNRPIQAIIFDMDGTLVNSEEASYECWRRVLASYNIEWTEDENTNLIGLRLDLSINYLLHKFDLGISYDDLFQQLSDMWHKITQDGFPPMAGVFDLFERVEAAGLPWAVATATERRTAIQILTDLGVWEKCHALVGGDEVANSKPDPEIYLKAASLLGVAAENCLTVEDSIAGHRSAAAANTTTIAIPNHWMDPAQFDAAHYRLTSLTEISEHFNFFMRSQI